MRRDCALLFVTSRRAPASGTRSNTACSPFISQNWRGKPLTSLSVIVSLLAATTTKAGLKVQADLSVNKYALGVKVSKKEFGEINLHRDELHGEWNYEIAPRDNGTVIS